MNEERIIDGNRDRRKYIVKNDRATARHPRTALRVRAYAAWWRRRHGVEIDKQIIFAIIVIINNIITDYCSYYEYYSQSLHCNLFPGFVNS